MSITEKKILTSSEQDRLNIRLDQDKDTRNGIMLNLLKYTGARQSELLLITPSDVGEGTVTIKGIKGSNDRTIPLPDDIFKSLIQYLAREKITDDQKIFPISSRQLRNIWMQYRPNKFKGAHSVRHTFGTQLYRHCRDVRKVQSALGHKEISNTIKYVDFIENIESLRKSMDGMFDKKK